MADTVTSQTLKDSATTWAVKLTNLSDGTGETNVVKVSANTLVASDGGGTQRLSINKIAWSVASGTSATISPRVTLLWRGSSSNTTVVTLTGSGFWDLTTAGNYHSQTMLLDLMVIFYYLLLVSQQTPHIQLYLKARKLLDIQVEKLLMMV